MFVLVFACVFVCVFVLVFVFVFVAVLVHDDDQSCFAHVEYLQDIKVHSTNANGVRARIRQGAFERCL